MSIFSRSGFDAEYRRSPLVLVDVGASGGAHGRWSEARPWLRTIGFDADARSPVGPDPSMTYLRSAVYREKARIDFHLTRKQETSSIFVPNRSFVDRFPESDRFDIVETISLDADTLDAQLSAAGISDIDFLKVDAQGCELAILEGAVASLRRSTLGLELEVEFAEVYEGQPLFAEVDAFARRQGFVLFDLRPFYWKRRVGQRLGGPRGQLVFGEALYLRDIDGLAVLLRNLASDEARRAKILHVLGVCWLYGYLDFAAEIIAAFPAPFSAAERLALEKSLSPSPENSGRLPNFPGRSRVANVLEHLYRAFRRGYRGWGDAGPDLGNR